jgi:hypothetical protein
LGTYIKRSPTRCRTYSGICVSAAFGGKRHKTNVRAGRPGILQRRALVPTAGAARGLPQNVARRVVAPADDGDRARKRSVVLAPLAIQPKPRRRAVQVA